MWTEESLTYNKALGVFFTVTGILGIIGGLLLFFRGQKAVVEDDKLYLRKVLLPIAIIGLIPSPGLVIVGVLLMFAWLMYRDDRYDFFGILLEETGPRRRRFPKGAEAAGAGDARDMYASSYPDQDLYTQDYAQASYGGGEGAYGTGDDGSGAEPTSLLSYDSDAEARPPMCSSCSKVTEWIEEYQRYYCYDCDRYV